MSRADIADLSVEKAVVMMLPCKNMQHMNGKTVPLVVGGGGTFIDAPAELLNLRRVDPVSVAEQAATPRGGVLRCDARREPLQCEQKVFGHKVSAASRRVSRRTLGAISARSRACSTSRKYRFTGSPVEVSASSSVCRSKPRWQSARRPRRESSMR